MVLLFGEARARRAGLEYRFERAITFDPNVGTTTNIYTSFWTMFSLELMWNRYSVKRRARRAGRGYRFERAITFDPTVGSPPNFNRSFRTMFSLQ